MGRLRLTWLNFNEWMQGKTGTIGIMIGHGIMLIGRAQNLECMQLTEIEMADMIGGILFFFFFSCAVDVGHGRFHCITCPK